MALTNDISVFFIITVIFLMILNIVIIQISRKIAIFYLIEINLLYDENLLLILKLTIKHTKQQMG